MFNGVTDDLLVVDGGFGGNFTKDHDHAGFGAGFTGNFGVWVLRQASVENGVGDTVTEFIGVAFIDGFGGEEKGIGFGFRHVGGVLCGSGGRRGVQNEKKEDLVRFLFGRERKASCDRCCARTRKKAWRGVVKRGGGRTTPTRRKVVVFGRGGGLACFLRETVSYFDVVDCWRPHIRDFEWKFDPGQHDSTPPGGQIVFFKTRFDFHRSKTKTENSVAALERAARR